ncbi:TetR/AcrR family transcriptional regulator [Alloalcanivorax marinus]|uniref:TetR/AcrR family transcriptional regulator n=1 Tax=Alloalcanivorax marinus TaxID=1177169 RepID=UPI001932633A|nr:TetR/AcrR family transcriptional regulator [Alloalcanivorax marinus]MBL7251887.1 TetR/AcrR family transcriptional regulator [Alloalcanivorax marinus]
MARPRQFDESEVLDAATRCFWRHGYQATSMRDLAAETNLTGASLYNAFGDKRALYRRVLAHYARHGSLQRIRELEGTLPPARAIRVFLQDIIERSLDDQDHKGCLLVNSALELAPEDEELQQAVNEQLAELEAFFWRCVRAGQKDGSISDQRPARELARFLLGILMGIRVLARAQPRRATLEAVLRPALSVLA